MSNHSAVTPDGGEIGRAQAVQAYAARIDTDRRMNPILLKPSRDRSHVVVLGEEVGTTDARDYGQIAAGLRPTVLEALTSLRGEYDIVVAEGAGGAAEINLLDRDLVNLPLAAAAGIPAVLVVDIDRGGAFAAAHGTLDLLPLRLRHQVVGIVFNSFRGDVSLLADGIAELERRDGVPVLGVLPHLGEVLMLGVEDSLDVRAGEVVGVAQAELPQPGPTRTTPRPAVPPRARRPIRIAAVRYPSLSNPSDLDPFLIEPDVQVRWVTRARDLQPADLIVLAGSRATVRDLAWLHARGFAAALEHTDAAIVGLCGGYQMLGDQIIDDVESGEGTVEGLGVLPVTTIFETPKVVRRSAGVWRARPHGPTPRASFHPAPEVSLGRGAEASFGSAAEAGLRGATQDASPRGTRTQDSPSAESPLAGYQIRWGRPRVQEGAASWLQIDGVAEGVWVQDGPIRCGTSVHGVFDNDAFRRQFLADVADACGRDYAAGPSGYEAALNSHAETLADWAEAHLDVGSLLQLARSAVPVGQEPGW